MNHLRARIYLSGLFLVMLAGLIYGFGWGDFWEDGGELMDNPWGIVSLVDVYVGFFSSLDGYGSEKICSLPNCSGQWRFWWAVISLPASIIICPWAEPGKAGAILLGEQGI